MRNTLTMTEESQRLLLDAIGSSRSVEGAAYLLCGQSIGGGETRLLVRDVVPVDPDHYLIREADRMSIASRSYASVAKRANAESCSVLFVHSHPSGFPEFSGQDNVEEPKLMEFLDSRVPGRHHGSLLVPQGGRMVGRLWDGRGWRGIDRIRIVGDRFRFLDAGGDKSELPEFFDRQVRAFGPDIQRLLGRLHVGVVGAGGTGSAVFEQMVRLGIGEISVFDAEQFESSNVNRVYGSGGADAGEQKTFIAERNASRVGVGTTVHAFSESINKESVAKSLRACDFVFGCTDKQSPRGILVRLALWYLIPVMDVGVKISSVGGTLGGVYGRITMLLPGLACLLCRRRISAEIIRLESLSPQERQALADENYAPELEETAPAVVSFTTAVAAQAVSELLHRLTGFMGADRRSSECLMLFHESSIRGNRTEPGDGCLCALKQNWGKGDRRNFLDLMWGE